MELLSLRHRVGICINAPALGLDVSAGRCMGGAAPLTLPAEFFGAQRPISQLRRLLDRKPDLRLSVPQHISQDLARKLYRDAALARPGACAALASVCTTRAGRLWRLGSESRRSKSQRQSGASENAAMSERLLPPGLGSGGLAPASTPQETYPGKPKAQQAERRRLRHTEIVLNRRIGRRGIESF